MTYLNDALATLSSLQADNLKQEVHNHRTVHVPQDVLHRAFHRLQQVQHFLCLFVKEGLVDLCEITRLEGVERSIALQKLPEIAEKRLALHKRIVH